MDINSVRYIGYVMHSAHGPCFVVRSSEKQSERGLINVISICLQKKLYFGTDTIMRSNMGLRSYAAFSC